MDTADGSEGSQVEPVERITICLPDLSQKSFAQCGDPNFQCILKHYYDSPENNATERLVRLKAKLTLAPTADFWSILLEEMCGIMGAQCGLVAKRMMVDGETPVVQLPSLGEPGSCLMGVGFYLDNGKDVKEMYHDYRYQAYER